MVLLWTDASKVWKLRHFHGVRFQAFNSISCLHWWTALLRFSLKFSGILLGHSRTSTLLSLNHFWVAFTVCFGSLSCYKINRPPSCSFLADSIRFGFQDVPIFCCMYFTFYLYKPSRACCREASQHEASTTKLYGCVCGDVQCLVSAKHGLMPKKL